MRIRIPHWRLWVAGLLIGLPLLGFLVAASGIVPIKASSGHWAITEWLLQFGKRRSVAMHSLGVSVPEERRESWVMKGAGHFETGCRPCHGAPGNPDPEVAMAMLPRPPWLPDRVKDRKDRELFYIVKHGIKFTGMPAWPVQDRDDEVIAMVAFLRRLPDLDAESYRRLVNGEAPRGASTIPLGDLAETAPAPPDIAASCARCHGDDGVGRGVGAFPKLAGQNREYLARSLDALADSRRQSGIMGPIAAALKPDERARLAAYFSGLPGSGATARQDTTAHMAGETIATDGIPDQNVPPCRACHGPASHAHNPHYPHLAGQYAEYLELQLTLFRDGRRRGSPWAAIMQSIASRLTPEQIRDVARWYAGLPPQPHGGSGR
ncbi:MAG TPA: c-type cytochrome [Gemmatimonadaceae bacterium]